MNTTYLLIRQALSPETFVALFTSFAAANCAYVSHLARQQHLQRWLIELRVMGQHCYRGRRIELHLLQHLIWPLNNQFIGMWKTLTRSKSSPRINNHNPVI